MADPFVAEIRVFPFNFAPKGWAMCDGQLMPISQNTALFSLLGTTYGGDGKSTFGLPDLQGRAPMHPGQGQGLSDRRLGESMGSSSHTLSEAEIPSHQHGVNHSDELLNTTSPEGGLPGASGGRGGGTALYHDSGATIAPGGASRASGGGQPHQNLQPYLTFNFCIALQGVYPQRP